MPEDIAIAPTSTPAPSTPQPSQVDAKPADTVKPIMAPATPPPTQRPSPMVAVKEALQRAVDKKAAKAAGEPAKTPEPPDKTPDKTPAASDLKVPDEAAEKPPGEPVKPTEEPPKTDDKKLGPWQLKEKWEKTAKTYERENADLRQKLASLGELETHKTRAEQAEARAKELEEAIRFVDYQKSEEFKEKYQEPYVKAWQRALSDLSQLTVTTSDGNERPADQSDMLRLAQLPLGEARRQAKELFGDSADDVMSHYRSIRETADAQTKALDDAKKAGMLREKEQTDLRTRVQTETQQLWQESVRADEEKIEYLRDKEDDAEWNERLNHARELVDTAFAKNADDPKLTREERAAIVKKHAALRSRAIAYSALKLQVNRLQAELAARDEKLKQYASAEPGNGDGNSGTREKAVASDPMERFRQSAMAIASKHR